jgi:hypothetical protein
VRLGKNLKSQFAFSKPNLLARRVWRRSHQLANGLLLAMWLIAPFQVRDLAGKLIYGKDHLPQTDKSAHDSDVDLNGARTVLNAGEHGDAFLGEGIGG